MRQVEINRETSETQITINLNLDGSGQTDFDTGLPFFGAYARSDWQAWNVRSVDKSKGRSAY